MFVHFHKKRVYTYDAVAQISCSKLATYELEFQLNKLATHYFMFTGPHLSILCLIKFLHIICLDCFSLHTLE